MAVPFSAMPLNVSADKCFCCSCAGNGPDPQSCACAMEAKDKCCVHHRWHKPRREQFLVAKGAIK